jgi:hypothetical protein
MRAFLKENATSNGAVSQGRDHPSCSGGSQRNEVAFGALSEPNDLGIWLFEARCYTAGR